MYRLDIHLALYKNGYEELLKFYEYNGFHHLFDENNIQEYKNGKIIVALDYLSFPKNETDINNLMLGLDYLMKNNKSFHYIRIGENDEDVKNMIFTAQKELPLSLRYPEFIMKDGEKDE